MAKSDYCYLSIGSMIKKPDGSLHIEGLKTDSDRPIEEETKLLNQFLEGLARLNASQSQTAPPIPTPLTPATENNDITISAAIKKYCAETKLSNGWGEPYEKQMVESLSKITLILGDQKVSSLTRDNAVTFFDQLQKLPPNIKKNKLYRKCSIDQILKMEYKQKIHPKTVKDIMDRIRGFSKWLHKHKYSSVDLFEDLKVKNLKKLTRAAKTRDRDRFYTDDLLKIFTNRVFTNHDFSNPYMFWLPLIALFSGMRMNEICQLRPENFSELDGIFFMDVTEDYDEGDDEQFKQRVKTEAGIRVVPIHPKLIEYGLLDYVKTRKKGGSIFDNLKEFDGRLSHYPSKWFNDRFRKEIGLAVRGKVFHSFRHTVIDELKQLDANLYKVKELVGHSRSLENANEEDITFDRYGKAYKVKVLNDVVCLLNFDDALTGVKKWTGRWKKTKLKCANTKNTEGGTETEPQMDLLS